MNHGCSTFARFSTKTSFGCGIENMGVINGVADAGGGVDVIVPELLSTIIPAKVTLYTSKAAPRIGGSGTRKLDLFNVAIKTLSAASFAAPVTGGVSVVVYLVIAIPIESPTPPVSSGISFSAWTKTDFDKGIFTQLLVLVLL